MLNYTTLQSVDLERRDLLGDIGVGGKIILKLMLKWGVD
jgi:hypothetical protein